MTEGGWQRTALTAVIGGAIGFLWCFADLLRKVQTWEIQWNPPEVGDLLMCVVYALVAVGFACKLDLPFVGALLRGDMGKMAKAFTSKE